jgi:hypothetical protein
LAVVDWIACAMPAIPQAVQIGLFNGNTVHLSKASMAIVVVSRYLSAKTI